MWKIDEPEEVVVEVESGEALGVGEEGGFPPSITSLMSPCIIKRTPFRYYRAVFM